MPKTKKILHVSYCIQKKYEYSIIQTEQNTSTKYKHDKMHKFQNTKGQNKNVAKYQCNKIQMEWNTNRTKCKDFKIQTPKIQKNKIQIAKIQMQQKQMQQNTNWRKYKLPKYKCNKIRTEQDTNKTKGKNTKVQTCQNTTKYIWNKIQKEQNANIPKYKHDKKQKIKIQIGQNTKGKLQFRQNTKRQNTNMAKYKVIEYKWNKIQKLKLE